MADDRYAHRYVELHDAAPLVGAQWEEVAANEDDRCGGRQVRRLDVSTTASELALEPAVQYRVRYCPSGMDRGREAEPRVQHEPEVDRYLLQFWPAPPESDVVVRHTSDIATYWHDFARNLPPFDELAAARAESAASLAQGAALAAAEEHERIRLQQENLRWSGRRHP